ncbi:unnamed protein product [Prorocentrum cordatum]|uniref:Uncharacterized protein n=1 Tax=Prorocentrum cordatum TaxID=2364126 RepID=A0ABN9S2M9_9DINO|nr:unnamed protein product [Polarella glacialis]
MAGAAAASVARAPRRGVKCSCSSCETQAPLSQCENFGDVFLCMECVDFGDQSGFELRTLAAMKAKSPAKWKERKAQKEEWAIGKNAPEYEREHPQEEVYEETVRESSLSEEFTFQPRDDFKGECGCLPDQANVTTLRVTNSKGEDTFGVVLADETASPPKLTVTATQRRLIKWALTLVKGRNYYEAQASNISENTSAERSLAHEQMSGGKCQPKVKKFSAYRKHTIKQLVKKNVGKPKGLRRMVRDGEVANESGSEAGAVTSEAEGGELDQEPAAGAAGQQAPPPARDGQASASAALQPSDAPKTPRAPGASSAAEGSKTKEKRAPDSECPNLTLAPSSKRPKAGTNVASSLAETAATAWEGESGRLKPPGHWRETLAPSRVLAGAPLKRHVGWAKDRVKRVAGVGESVKENMAATKVDFDSVIEGKLLGKRWASPFLAFSNGDTDDACVEELAETTMPSAAGKQEASQGASCDADGDEAKTQRTSEEFDPMDVSMATTDGKMGSRMPLLLSVLLKEIAPAAMQAGVAEMDEIPSSARDTLGALRVTCALGNSAAEMNSDALCEFTSVQPEKAKGALADLGATIRMDEHWTKTFEGLHRTIQDARERMPKIFTSASHSKALKTSVAPSNLPSAITDEAFDTLKSCRQILRAGSARVLGIERAGTLGAIMEQMFDKNGAVNGGGGCSKGELIATDKMFKDGMGLKCFVEEFGTKVREGIATVIERAGAKKIMRGLTGKMTGGAKAENTNADFERVRAVEGALQNIGGGSRDVGGKAAALSFCNNMWGTIKDEANATNGEVAGIMQDVAGATGDGIIDIFKAFHAASEAKFSIAAHVAMASGSEEIALDQIMQDIPEGERKQVLVDAHTTTKNYIANIGDQATGNSKAKLDDKVNLTAKWAKGGADGQSWWAAANDESDLDEVLPLAQARACKHASDSNTAEKNNIQELLKVYKEMASVFTRVRIPGSTKAASEVMTSLAQSHIEGLVVALFSAKYSKEELKKVFALKKLANQEGAKWDKMPPALLERAMKASKLQ